MTKEEIINQFNELNEILKNKYIPFPVNSVIQNRAMLLRKKEIEMKIADGTIDAEQAQFPLKIVNEALNNFQSLVEQMVNDQERHKSNTPTFDWTHPLIAGTKIEIEKLNKLLKEFKYEADIAIINDAIRISENEIEKFKKEYGKI